MPKRYESQQDSDDQPKGKQKIIKKKGTVKRRDSSSENSSIGNKSEQEKSERMSEQSERYTGRQSRHKKAKHGISQFIQESAQQVSDSESLDSSKADDLEQRKDLSIDIYKAKEKPITEQLIDKLDKFSENELNEHYARRAKLKDNISQSEQEKEGANDQDIYQVKCPMGMEEELVGCILNKCRYASIHPEHYFCNITAVMCLPKRFPGYLFLEGENIEDLRKSIDGFKGVKLNSLQKMDFELYSTLFDPLLQSRHDFKNGQYVRIKTGMYRDDLGQITKINKKGVIVQVVPRINFADIYQRMKQIEIQYGKLNYKEHQIVKIKNTRFKEMTDPKMNYQIEGRPDKKNLTPLDFQPFSDFAQTKNIKITAQGLLLVHYAFNEVEYPKTTVSPLELIALNPSDLQKGAILKKQAKKVKLALDVKKNDLVQIIHGELKGAYGRVFEKFTKMVRIKCQNPDIRNLIIDEVNDYVQKMFKQGDNVVIVEGSYKGEEGEVYRNGRSNVHIITSNKERVQILKRNVHLKMETSVTFTNDLGLRKDDIVKTRYALGIVCETKKNYVDFVTPKNEIQRGMNNDVTKITNYYCRGYTKDREQVKRNCLVVILSGMKKEKSFKVKQVYDNYLFLQDPDENNLQGNWVERAENCRLYLKVMPRIEAKFLADEGRFRQFSRDQPKPPFNFQRSEVEDVMADEDFKVGKPYKVTHGVYKGVKGVIVAAFKTHINVCVFNNQIERIDRLKLVKFN